MSAQRKKWYRNWFNSPYYHILYSNRDLKEAEHFIDNICDLLKPSAESTVLDAGCGRGRHSIYLNKKGLDVTGIDLSPENIQYARQFSNERLNFHIHDMRNILCSNYFDFVFNLFTSFGYFRNERDNLRAIQMFASALKPNGILLIDFINAKPLAGKLVKEEEKTVSGITFNISRKIVNKMILKEIRFRDQDEEYFFTEEVKALNLSDFEKYFKQKNLKIIHLFGDYDLNPYDENTSERLIMICSK